MIQFAALAASAAVGVGKAIAGEIAAATTKATGAGQTGATAASSAASAKAKKTSTEFEKMFLEQSFDRLTKSEGTDGPMGENGTGGDVYRSMLTKEYASQVVKSGGVGIADQVYKEMMKMQEAGGAGKA